MYVYIVFQQDPCGDEMIIGVYDNLDSANASVDAGVMAAALMRRVEQFIVESKYDPEEDWAALNEQGEV